MPLAQFASRRRVQTDFFLSRSFVGRESGPHPLIANLLLQPKAKQPVQPRARGHKTGHKPGYPLDLPFLCRH